MIKKVTNFVYYFISNLRSVHYEKEYLILLSFSLIVFLSHIFSLFIIEVSPQLNASNLVQNGNVSQDQKKDIKFDKKLNISISLTSPNHSGKIIDKFGMQLNPSTEKVKMHKGIDVAAQKGTKVYAVAEARYYLLPQIIYQIKDTVKILYCNIIKK